MFDLVGLEWCTAGSCTNQQLFAVGTFPGDLLERDGERARGRDREREFRYDGRGETGA